MPDTFVPIALIVPVQNAITNYEYICLRKYWRIIINLIWFMSLFTLIFLGISDAHYRICYVIAVVAYGALTIVFEVCIRANFETKCLLTECLFE
jgi:hypothetical protein